MIRNYILFFGILLLTSCFKYDNHEFPKTVAFSSDGGEMEIFGGVQIIGFSIYEKNEDDGVYQNTFEDGSMEAAYQWLSVKGKRLTDGIVIKVEPNTSNKSRYLNIMLHYDPEYGYIKVKQEGKKQ